MPLFSEAAQVLTLTSLKKPCAIASNTHSDLIKVIVKDSIHNLPPVIGGEGLPSKPAPDIFLKAAKFLRVAPSKCLVFEDAWKGITAANSAGMPAVLVRNQYNKNLPAKAASCEIQGLSELFVFLRRLN